MRQFQIFILIIITTAVMVPLDAQEKTTIRGKVTDEDGNPFSYVNIFISETFEGTTTNDSGYFELHTSANKQFTLNVTMIGYTSYQKIFDLSNNTKIPELQIQLSTKSIELEETIVMGSSFSSEKGKGLVITSRDVMTTPGGAADLFQSIKTLPGMTQVSESAELYVRGGDPSETVTLIDQASIYHPYTYESSYGGLFSNLNTGAISEMYFSSGGFSSKYGNVLSGVLDIQTKNLPSQTGFAVGISMASASFDGEIPIVQDKVGLRFYSQKSYTKPIMWLNGGLDDFAATPTSQNITASLIYSFSKTGKIKFTSILAGDEQGVNINRAEFAEHSTEGARQHF